MCGIAGIINGDSSKIKLICDTIRHRGPDSAGVYVNEQLALGHQRLSIIDLSTEAGQPFTYIHNSKEYKIIFNGELYNYIELKAELLQLGYNFTTNSDTEVLVAAFIEWGTASLNRFNGMWSFVIYDIAGQKLFISRDRLGVKPLYYFQHKKTFVFASEIKAIYAYHKSTANTSFTINDKALQLYFSLGYIPSPYSIYNEIQKLPAGHLLKYDLPASTYQIEEYYHPFTTKHSNKPSLEEFDHLFSDAVKIRLRSDVPVGAFLSGGIDSTGIVSSMLKYCDPKQLHTFSIGFEGSLDESSFIYEARDYFKISNHHHTYFKDGQFEEYMDDFVTAFDEPFGDYSGFPSLMVNKMAKDYTTVVLSGDGGDELFGGYNIYNKGLYVDLISKYLPFSLRKSGYQVLNKVAGNRAAVRYAKQGLKQSLYSKSQFYTNYLSEERYNPEVLAEWSVPRLEKCLEFHDNQLAEGLRSFDQMYNTLPDKYLTKVDRTSMKYAVEVRSPFLDYRLVDFANRLTRQSKISIGSNKIFLKEYFKEKIPSSIITRKKHGFTPPMVNWISNGNRLETRDLSIVGGLNEGIAEFYRTNIFSINPVQFAGEYIIRLFIFNQWYNRWM